MSARRHSSERRRQNCWNRSSGGSPSRRMASIRGLFGSGSRRRVDDNQCKCTNNSRRTDGRTDGIAGSGSWSGESRGVRTQAENRHLSADRLIDLSTAAGSVRLVANFRAQRIFQQKLAGKEATILLVFKFYLARCCCCDRRRWHLVVSGGRALHEKPYINPN